MEYATLIVMLALIEYLWFTIQVGSKRVKGGVQAPAVTGDEAFERAFRVQQNTLEQLIIFVPATFTYAWYVSPLWVVLPGGLFLIGRFLYSVAYMKAPSSRGPGFGMGLVANLWLVVGTVASIVLDMI